MPATALNENPSRLRPGVLMITLSRLAALGVIAAAFAHVPALAQEAAGANFPAPLYSKWAADFNKATGRHQADRCQDGGLRRLRHDLNAKLAESAKRGPGSGRGMVGDIIGTHLHQNRLRRKSPGSFWGHPRVFGNRAMYGSRGEFSPIDCECLDCRNQDGSDAANPYDVLK